VWIVSIVFFFEFADLNTFAYAAPALRALAGFSLGDIAAVTSAGFLGMFVGAVLVGYLSDRIGRRRALTYSTALFSVFSLLTAVCNGVGLFGVVRFLTGVGLSAMTVVAITYLNEVMPATLRGRAQSTTLAVGLAGIPAVSFFARGVVPIGTDGWRLIFVFGGLALLVMGPLRKLPESPRWLALHGRSGEAEAALAQLGVDEHELKSGTDDGALGRASRQRLRQLLTPALRRRTLVLLVTWVLAMLGFYAFAAWVPALLAEHGMTLTKSLLFSSITTLGAVPGALLARAIADRFSRKNLMAVVAVLIAASGVGYGLSSQTVGILVFGTAVSLLSQTFVAIIYTYTPEVFPTASRASGCGLVYGAGRLANVVGPLLVPAIFVAFGYATVFVFIAGCWLFAGLVVALFGPSTNQSRRNTPAARDLKPDRSFSEQ
jgi:putative MFS transporter